MNDNILLNFPNMLKIGYTDEHGIFNFISLSITNNITLTKTQSVQSFPVSRRYQYLNGVVRDLTKISIEGIVVDDSNWGAFIDLAYQTNIAYRSLKTKREYYTYILESFMDDELLLKIEDSQIGIRNDLIITSLTQTNSPDIENATVWSIEFTQIPIISTVDYEGNISQSNTIDPYIYYNYLSTKVKPEGL